MFFLQDMEDHCSLQLPTPGRRKQYLSFYSHSFIQKLGSRWPLSVKFSKPFSIILKKQFNEDWSWKIKCYNLNCIISDSYPPTLKKIMLESSFQFRIDSLTTNSYWQIPVIHFPRNWHHAIWVSHRSLFFLSLLVTLVIALSF